MATAAQIEANRRNAKKSTGPRTEEGKNRSRFNAVDHGCRARILVLPTEEFGDYEREVQGWKETFRPKNPAEEFLIERIVSLGCLTRRIYNAETARLNKRIHFGVFDEDAKIEAEVIELSQKLFQNACGPVALHLERASSELALEGETFRISDYDKAEDHPRRLVQRLKTTGAGCQWLLEQWADLRGLLDRGGPWLAPDKLKVVRLLGRHPIDAVECEDVARVYLASFRLLDQEGDPFQEILNDLSEAERGTFTGYLKHRQYERLAPIDSEAAREMLREIVDRAVAVLEDKADVHGELEKIRLETAGHRLSWDDTPEGERLRRYEIGCQRMWSRLFDLLLKLRSNRTELDIASIASMCQSVPTVIRKPIDQPERFVIDDEIAPDVPASHYAAPNEANFPGANAPNEANSGVRQISLDDQEGRKDVRIDLPHAGRKPGAIGKTAKATRHPALDDMLSGRRSTLMDLSPIFGTQELGGAIRWGDGQAERANSDVVQFSSVPKGPQQISPGQRPGGARNALRKNDFNPMFALKGQDNKGARATS